MSVSKIKFRDLNTGKLLNKEELLVEEQKPGGRFQIVLPDDLRMTAEDAEALRREFAKGINFDLRKVMLLLREPL